MPTLPLVPNVTRVTLRFSTTSSNPASCRFYMAHATGTQSAADLNAIATRVQSLYAATLAGNAHPDIALVEVDAVDLGNAASPLGVWTGSVAGGDGGSTLTAGTATLINYHIARRYRGGRPRIYLPFGSSSQLANNNEWTTTYATGIAGVWSSFITSLVATTGLTLPLTNHVNVSYYQGFHTFTGSTGRVRNISNVRSSPQVDAITAYTAPVRVAGQRRRKNL